MEKKLSLNWCIYSNEIDSEYRYCHNCGKKVTFKDSLKRRQNANGKNIYHFAIYKCEQGHTWNKPLETFKAMDGLENNVVEKNYLNSEYENVNISELVERGIKEVEILLFKFEGKIRLDKFMADRICDISRSSIVKQIENGNIRVNGELVKHSFNLKEKDCITLYI